MLHGTCSVIAWDVDLVAWDEMHAILLRVLVNSKFHTTQGDMMRYDYVIGM